MKKLILIRHSYAEDSSFSKSDIERDLTASGVKHAINQCKLLKDANFSCDKIISSHAVRAMHTAKIFIEGLGFSGEIEQAAFLYEDYTTQNFISFIHKQLSALNTLLIVGHNPTLSNIAYRLAPNFKSSVKPGTVIIIDFNIDNWKNVEVGQGSISCVI